jgi:NAD(P)-dependent dehydrogenase (short-subunit alcohol dehydrogenase family)
MNTKLKGKVALVTGAASRAGIGYAIARELAAEGSYVIATDIRSPLHTAKEIAASGGAAAAMAMDVTNPEDVNRVMDEVWDQHGKLDILVNNAGICPFVPFLELTKEIWDLTIDVNLTGVFHCSQAAARRMIRYGQRGKIIIISSFCVEYPSPNQTHYAASKGGVYMLAKNMALELAPYYINVNSIAPGGVNSTNIASAGERILRDMGLPEKTANDMGALGQEIPSSEQSVLERNLIPYDIARAAVFLASADADHISGQTLFVNGFEHIV